MKTIELKTIDNYSYKQNIKELVETAQGPLNPNTGQFVGLTSAEIIKSIKILDVLEESTDTLELEDDYYNHLLYILSITRFLKVHRPTIQMIEDIKNS